MGYVEANLIDQQSLSRLSYAAHDSITTFFQDEKNQKEFEEWLKKRRKKEQ